MNRPNSFFLIPKIYALAACFPFFSIGILSASAEEWDTQALQRTLDQAGRTFVTVECVSQFEGFGQSRAIPRKVSGFVVSATGMVMVPRNMEVMESARGSFSLSRPEKIEIVFQDHSRRPGTYIGVDPDLEISFFAVDEEGGEEFPALELVERNLELGDAVYAARLLPEEYDPRLEGASARISLGLTKPSPLYRTQPGLAAFNGFPVFDDQGRVIGFLKAETGGNPSEEAMSLISGAAPIVPAARYLDMIAHPPTKLEKGWLGIRMQPLREDLAETWNIPGSGGIIISDTIEGSPAAECGLLPEDIILAVNGKPLRVNSYADLDFFRQEVRKKKPGDTLNMKVVRGASKFGKEPVENLEIPVILALSPPSQTEAETLTFPEVGLKIRVATLDYLFSNRLPQNTQGVVADYVESAGPAHIGELREDDLILSIADEEVVDLESAKKVFERLRTEKPEEVILHVLRDQNRLFLKITPDWE